MLKPFRIQKHTTLDKEFEISGPYGLRLRVDYDDVNHKQVDKAARRMVSILNDHWHREGK